MRADEVYAILKGKIVKLTEDIKEVGDWKPIRHQGTVQTAEDLPADAKEGYMYNIATDSIYGAAGMNVVKTADGWDPMGPIVNMDLYLSKEEAKKGYQPAGDYLTENKAKKTYQPVGNYSTKEETEKKLNKNQGINNAGKITGINADGDIVPVFPTGVQYNEETNLLEFGTDPNMLNKGIQLDATLKKSGYAADSAAVGENIDSLKEDISTKITKFYASSQGETHLADSDNGKIMDMMLYGKSEQKRYSGKNLLNATLQTTTQNGVTCTANGDGTYTINGTATSDTLFHIGYFIFEKDTKYKIVGCPQGGSLNTLYRLDGSLNANSDTGNGIVYSGDGNKRNARIVVFNGATVDNLLFKPMITTDLTATYDDFEPYTGGIPSPNPDYPQEIKSVANPTVKVCGNNLYPDGDLIELTKSYTTDFIPVVFNRNTIYLAFECNTNTVDGKYYINMIYYDKNKQKLGSNGSASQIGEKITKIEDSSSFNGIGAGNGGTNVDLKKVSYVKIVFNIYDNTATKITYKNIVVSSTPTAYEPYHEQTVTLPYTLNAIPVNSGGNVTIDGQQYIADYVDVERGKLVRMVEKKVLNGTENWNLSERSENRNGVFQFFADTNIAGALCDKAIYESLTSHYGTFDTWYNQIRFYAHTDEMTVEEWRNFLSSNNHVIYIVRNTPVKTDLTKEEITAFKALTTYYPTTNIFANSEQLDGYTVFNYPISMENGWNYVKQQIGDTREYIYDMDIQSAEAYVNSEYAVALTELEV